MALKIRSAAPVARPMARAVCPARATRLVCQARNTPLAGKPLTGSCVLQLSSGVHRCDKQTMRTNNPETDLNKYMYSLSQDFGILQMPLGASLRKLGGGGYEIFVPKIEILDVWFQPKALAAVKIATPPEKRMELMSNTCLLEGSSHVQDLKLNDAFNLDVKVAFTWKDGSDGQAPTIMSEASIDVDVDIPFPFSALPKPALEIPGNAAFNATLDIMLNGFVSSLVQDYQNWASNPALRADREAKTAATSQ